MKRVRQTKSPVFVADDEAETLGRLDGATARKLLPWRFEAEPPTLSSDDDFPTNVAKKSWPRRSGTSERGRRPPWVDESEKAIPAAPDSGVRASTPNQLSYRAYTLSEREVGVPRPSLAASGEARSLPPPHYWEIVRRSGAALLVALWGYLRSRPRPRLLDVCRFPAVTFAGDLKRALKSVDWRKVGIVFGFGAFALVVLLVAVTLAAKVTDSVSTTTVRSAKIAVPGAGATPTAAAAGAVMELDDEPAPVAAPSPTEDTKPGAVTSPTTSKKTAPAKPRIKVQAKKDDLKSLLN